MIENLENEQWLPIEGYEDYEVSNYGRVKSLGNDKTRKEKILKPNTNKDGYQLVQLWKDGKPKTFQVHRLVAIAFIPNPNNYEQVNHKDENKCNNHVDNLEWCDRKYNCNYGTRNERQSKAMLGKNNSRSKQVIQLTLNNEVVKIWECMHDVERELGFANTHISECCRNKLKTSNGFIWRYVN